MRCLALLALTVAPLTLAAAETASPSPRREEVVELVRLLGDDRFKVREEASERLLKLGLAAKPFLLEGTRDADLEVRRRCLELLPAVLDADLQARVQAFLADKDGKRDHDLPGLKRYRKLAGDDAAARLLFAEIQKTEAGRFVAESDARPDTAGDALAGRCQMLQQQFFNPQANGHRPVAVSEVAALLLVAADERVRVPLQSVYLINNLFYQPAVRAALTAPTASPLKRLLVAWMSGQTDPNVIQQMLYLSMNLELKEALALALRVVHDKTIKGHPLGLALTCVGKLGTKEHLPVFEPFLADTTVVGNFNFNNIRGTTELRDVALGMMVQLTGQSHRAYGFAFVGANEALKFNPFYLGFATPAQREVAFKKWQTFAATAKK